jgi:hypothetical protein
MTRQILLLSLLAGASASAGVGVLIDASKPSSVEEPARIVRKGETELPADKFVAGADADDYFEIPQGVGKPPEVAGSATYEFEVAGKGDYYLWIRAWWLDGCGNSIGVQFDDGPELVLGQDATYKKWHWVKLKGRASKIELAGGKHALKLANREDGVAIDQILVTKNKRYVPVGVEK